VCRSASSRRCSASLESEHERLRRCTLNIASARRDDAQQFFPACAELYDLALDVRRRLRSNRASSPILDSIVDGRIDGRPLTDAEYGSYFIILMFAGSETTRNASAAGLRLLSTRLAQRARWAADFETHRATGVEEVLRLATPVRFMRRTVAKPVHIAGRQLEPGEIVVIVYWGANRDSSVFAHPYEFFVDRAPNRHFAFGAPGPHICLGAHLARQVLGTLFQRIFKRAPDLAVTGDQEALYSGFLGGVTKLWCDRDALATS